MEIIADLTSLSDFKMMSEFYFQNGLLLNFHSRSLLSEESFVRLPVTHHLV